ncbi:hypothetical protein N9Z45_00015 [Akkermansiaceae bacterium]|nr:hypothetical protein [Akkermansiaceae bacterium]MDB4456032.1 hypothetical protein [bacterium]MDB4320292.1 hypothetical protein [Akkermansiaceae bacterium]MDB4363899.1 hypothetical protein [Akkermansiaceae bacterium]MDB4381432.1 hypothetical protein [Akkermansiaceae bacterium]
MKRLIVWSWSKDPSIMPIEALIDSGDVEIAAWFTREGKKTHRTKHFSYQPEIMLEELAQKAPKKNYHLKASPEELAVEFTHFEDIYSRVNFSKGQDYFDHLNLFHLYYQFFTAMLIEGKVDAVVYFTAPHAGADYVLYCAARRLGIETILTLQSPIPNRFFCVKDLKDFGTFATSPEIGEPIELTIPKSFEKKHFYMSKIPHKRGWLLSRFFRDCWWATFGGRQPLNWGGVFQKQAGRIAYSKRYQKEVVATVDFEKKYVYFPLQLQPELTTSILGNEFSDQLLALEKLSSIIPDDWHIYAKENPKQGFQQRGNFFFERFNRIPNCHYIGTEVGTYDLMAKCQFVASITGTACWESVSGGKPALIFGNVWFKTLPGVVSWHSDLTLNEIIGPKIDHSELEATYSSVMSKTIPGIVDIVYQKIHPDFSEKENGRLLTDFLRKALKLPLAPK